MEEIVNSFKKDYIRFLKSTKNYSLKNNLMENFLLAVVSIISLIISFFKEKVLTFLFSPFKIHKKQTSHNTVEHNFLIKENKHQVSLLTELNFCKSFYTPL